MSPVQASVYSIGAVHTWEKTSNSLIRTYNPSMNQFQGPTALLMPGTPSSRETVGVNVMLNTSGANCTVHLV